MLRNRAVALILCWLASPFVYSLGLGPIEANSALNEPFIGRIEILGAKPEDFDSLTTGLAGEEQFVRAGINRDPVLFQLRFRIDDTGAGKDYITISSKDPIGEPFLNFLLELNWPNGRLLREYTVLLDPPLYDRNRNSRAAPAVVAQPPGTAATVGSASAGMAAPAGAGSYGAGQQIGPVEAGDTLWSLALAHRPNSGISVQQMMLALLRQNPEAFSQGNINLLRRGAVLRLPDDASLNAVATNEAAAEVRRQHQVWEDYRQQIGSAPTPTPLGAGTEPATAPEASPSSAADTAADARLELVAPGAAEGGGTPGGAAASGGGTELAHEASDTKSQEAAELKDKLAEAEEIIDLLKRQVNIKDEELAALQARLAELGVQTEQGAASSVDPAEVAEPTAAQEPETEVEGEPNTSVAEVETEAAVEIEDPAIETEPPATEELPVVDESSATTDEVVTADTESLPEAADDEQEIADETEPAQAAGFPANLIPAGLADLVPGGAVTILGAIVLVVLGLFAAVAQFLFKSRAGRDAPAEPRRKRIEAEAVTITAATVAAAADSEAVTEFGTTTLQGGSGFDPNATVEAVSAEAVTEVRGAEVGDPLEEVNVYLAYERFDQAEELVKRVITQYPTRHEYKLRLLEVYYSSNNLAAYEAAARDLVAKIGEQDPLWASAVAMWSEMSPGRALFAAGEVSETPSAPQSTKAFVDITGDSGEGALRPGEGTLAHAPVRSADSLDFDLGSAVEAGPEVFDLTGSSGEGIIDLTASEAPTATSASEIFDLTADDGSADAGMLDLTGGDAGLLDITGGNAALDLTGMDDLDLGGSSSLLDVTRTGDVSDFDGLDILNVTSPGLRSQDQPEFASTGSDVAGLAITQSDATAAGAAVANLDFDISDTAAMVFNPADGSDEIADDEILDISIGESAGSDGDIEFDIAGTDSLLEGATESAGMPTDAAAGIDLDLSLPETGSRTSGELDFDITMGPDELSVGVAAGQDDGAGAVTELGDLESVGELDFSAEMSLQGSELDEIALDGLTENADEEFDFGLDGTTDMVGIAAEDTLDMASVVSGSREVVDNDEEFSLGELTAELNSSVPGGRLETIELELDSDGLPVELEFEGEQDDAIGNSEATVVMPRLGRAEDLGDDDESDTKLSLAKAYIELGDTEGARSILDEVAVGGNTVQKTEARALLRQISK